MQKTASQIADQVLSKLGAETQKDSKGSKDTSLVLGGLYGGSRGSILGGLAGGLTGQEQAQEAGDKALRDLYASHEFQTWKGHSMHPKTLNTYSNAAFNSRVKRLLKGVGGGAALGLGLGIGGTALYNYLKENEV